MSYCHRERFEKLPYINHVEVECLHSPWTADTEMDGLECRLLFMVLSVSYPIDAMQYFHEPQKQEFKGQPQANAIRKPAYIDSITIGRYTWLNR